MPRVRFTFLCSLQDILDAQLAAGMLDFAAYTAECERIYAATGWTSAEFSREVDSRWGAERPVKVSESKQIS